MHEGSKKEILRSAYWSLTAPNQLMAAGCRGVVPLGSLGEDALARFRGRYYLTLRHDKAAYVATSDDGLHYGNLALPRTPEREVLQ